MNHITDFTHLPAAVSLISNNLYYSYKCIILYFVQWPFVRFYGIQEPASSLFSLLNGVTVLIGYLHYSSTASSNYHASSAVKWQFGVTQNICVIKLYFEYCYLIQITLNAWLWSTIFHARDFPLTEKLDYFSAAGLIVAGLVVQFIRSQHFHNLFLTSKMIICLCTCV